MYLTKNGGELLKGSLASVFLQKTNFAFEVIAVDSGSTDATMETLREYAVTIYTIAPEKFNFGRTRDYGFELAQGEIVVVLSQDAQPVGDSWLQNIVNPFQDVSVAVVQGGSAIPARNGLFFWDTIGLFYYTRDAQQWLKLYNNIGLSFTNCAIRRSVWIENKIGEIEMSEDKYFQKKIVARGYKILLQKSAYVAHAHSYSCQSLRKRCENEGLGLRAVGMRYSLFDMIKDMLNIKIWIIFILALSQFKIKEPAEVMFPIIRPLFLFRGNKFLKKYVS